MSWAGFCVDLGVEGAGMLGLLRQNWGLGAWPGAQLLSISRWRREKCQLILDCKHIPVPTPLIQSLLQPPSLRPPGFPASSL